MRKFSNRLLKREISLEYTAELHNGKRIPILRQNRLRARFMASELHAQRRLTHKMLGTIEEVKEIQLDAKELAFVKWYLDTNAEDIRKHGYRFVKTRKAESMVDRTDSSYDTSEHDPNGIEHDPNGIEHDPCSSQASQEANAGTTTQSV